MKCIYIPIGNKGELMNSGMGCDQKEVNCQDYYRKNGAHKL